MMLCCSDHDGTGLDWIAPKQAHHSRVNVVVATIFFMIAFVSVGFVHSVVRHLTGPMIK